MASIESLPKVVGEEEEEEEEEGERGRRSCQPQEWGNGKAGHRKKGGGRPPLTASRMRPRS